MLKVPKAKRCEASPAVVSCGQLCVCERKVAPCCLLQCYGAVQCCAGCSKAASLENTIQSLEIARSAEELSRTISRTTQENHTTNHLEGSRNMRHNMSAARLFNVFLRCVSYSQVFFFKFIESSLSTLT